VDGAEIILVVSDSYYIRRANMTTAVEIKNPSDKVPLVIQVQQLSKDSYDWFTLFREHIPPGATTIVHLSNERRLLIERQ
jgi:hypothetical protein